jgi:hypothetical protein
MVSVPGVTADTTITSATFSFGTTAGGDIPGVPPICPVHSPVRSRSSPPASALSACLVGAIRRRLSPHSPVSAFDANPGQCRLCGNGSGLR